MKIAIMTQPLGRNFGGIMQAWALQKVLSRMGHQVITIDRQADKPNFIYLFARFLYRKLIIKSNQKIESEIYSNYKFDRTHRFIISNIIMSGRLDSVSKLKAHFDKEKYDAVIVGSDQVWRPKYSPDIKNFFLDFVAEKKIKRIAYAASFGVDEWEFNIKQRDKCAILIKKFNFISVREDSGVNLCSKYFNVSAEHVLDPTLLLDKSDYENLIGEERLKEKSSGLYTYFLDPAPEKTIFAQKMSAKTGEEIYSCQNENYVDDKNISENFKADVMADPIDWLAGFANAKYVLTDSFHGMVFSLIFEKPFSVIINNERGAARFSSLIDVLNLPSSCIMSGSDLILKKPEFPDTYLESISALKSKSLMLLRGAL